MKLNNKDIVLKSVKVCGLPKKIILILKNSSLFME